MFFMLQLNKAYNINDTDIGPMKCGQTERKHVYHVLQYKVLLWKIIDILSDTSTCCNHLFGRSI